MFGAGGPVDDAAAARQRALKTSVFDALIADHARINKRLEAHFHQDFGMGVANTIMALAEGVEVMHTTVLGIGERSGNTPMEETVMALKTMYGVEIKQKSSSRFGTAQVVS